MNMQYIPDYALLGLTAEDFQPQNVKVASQVYTVPVEYQAYYIEKVAEFVDNQSVLAGHRKALIDSGYHQANYDNMMQHGGIDAESAKNWKATNQYRSGRAAEGEKYIRDNWTTVQKGLNPHGKSYSSADEYIKDLRGIGSGNSQREFAKVQGTTSGRTSYFNKMNQQNTDFMTKNNIQYKPVTSTRTMSSRAGSDFKTIKGQFGRFRKAYQTGGFEGVMNYAERNAGKLTSLASGMAKRYGPVVGAIGGMTGAGKMYMNYRKANNFMNKATGFVSRNKGLLMGAGGLAIGATALSHAMSRANDTRMNQ